MIKGSYIKTEKVLSWLVVREIKLIIPKLTEAFDGYRILQISDIHAEKKGYLTKDKLAQVVDVISRYKVDTQVITGDFVTEWTDDSNEILSPLKNLSAPDGVYAVLGNHDHWKNPEKVRSLLKDFNILELNNSYHTVNKGQDMLHFVGGDILFQEGRNNYSPVSMFSDRLKEVVDNMPKEGNAILFVHEPDIADISSQFNRFDLEISGHSHGGQIRIFGFPKFIMDKYVLPEFGKKYVYGLYKVNNMWHYTNAGLGTCLMPIRVNCPSEISIFTLSKE